MSKLVDFAAVEVGERCRASTNHDEFVKIKPFAEGCGTQRQIRNALIVAPVKFGGVNHQRYHSLNDDEQVTILGDDPE